MVSGPAARSIDRYTTALSVNCAEERGVSLLSSLGRDLMTEGQLLSSSAVQQTQGRGDQASELSSPPHLQDASSSSSPAGEELVKQEGVPPVCTKPGSADGLVTSHKHTRGDGLFSGIMSRDTSSGAAAGEDEQRTTATTVASEREPLLFFLSQEASRQLAAEEPLGAVLDEDLRYPTSSSREAASHSVLRELKKASDVVGREPGVGGEHLRLKEEKGGGRVGGTTGSRSVDTTSDSSQSTLYRHHTENCQEEDPLTSLTFLQSVGDTLSPSIEVAAVTARRELEKILQMQQEHHHAQQRGGDKPDLGVKEEQQQPGADTLLQLAKTAADGVLPGDCAGGGAGAPGGFPSRGRSVAVTAGCGGGGGAGRGEVLQSQHQAGQAVTGGISSSSSTGRGSSDLSTSPEGGVGHRMTMKREGGGGAPLDRFGVGGVVGPAGIANNGAGSGGGVGEESW